MNDNGSTPKCLNCGALLTGKWQKKFCCLSCASSYNNKKRTPLDNKTKTFKCVCCGREFEAYYTTPHKYAKCEKCKQIKNNNKNQKSRIKYIKKCEGCGKEFVTYKKHIKLCSRDCTSKYLHIKGLTNLKEKLKYYYEHQNEFSNIQDYKIKKLKSLFIEEQNNKCAICGVSQEWNGKHLQFILDHIDGNATNNMRNNLRCICPNCDSQLDTYKSKNKHSTRRDYYREKTIRLAQEKWDCNR